MATAQEHARRSASALPAMELGDTTPSFGSVFGTNNDIGGEEEKGFYTAMASLNQGRLHITTICVGQSIRILDESVRFADKGVQIQGGMG